MTFSSLSFEDKVKIKELGRSIFYLDIKKREKSKNNNFVEPCSQKREANGFFI